MRTWTLILSFLILMTLSACKEGSFNASTDYNPQKVVITPDKYRGYEGLPLNLTDILVSLEFNETDVTQKEFGSPSEWKIKYFDVKAYVEYDDGWLIASGLGEWGGVVFWIDKNGGYEIIRDDNLAYPIDVVIDNSTVFISQGMSHLSLSDGHLLELNRNNGTFETNIYPINLYPKKFETYDGEWIIPVDSGQAYFIVSELRAGKSLTNNRK